MAAFNEADGTTNNTTFGSEKAGPCVVQINTKAGTASALILVDSSGVEWAFWVQSNVLKFGTRAQLVAQSGGTSV